MSDLILKAKTVPYSSVVGSSVSLQNKQGAVVALLIISIPNPSFDYKETAKEVAEMTVRGINSAAALAACVKALEETDAVLDAVLEALIKENADSSGELSRSIGISRFTISAAIRAAKEAAGQ